MSYIVNELRELWAEVFLCAGRVKMHREMFTAGVLKLFHVKDPQIDTFWPADPHLKRYMPGTPIREDLYGSSSDSQPF